MHIFNTSIKIFISELQFPAPIQAFKDFLPSRPCQIACVELQAGEEKEVSVTLHARDFAVITEDGGCVVRPGEYEISIGGQQPGERSRALTGRETEILTVRKEGNEENVEY